MGRRGPPPLPPKVVEMRGTTNTARARDYVVEQLSGEVTRPGFLKGKSRKKFDELVGKFMKRGQQVVGLEDMIAVYANELAQYDDDARKGIRWTAAQINALKGLAVQFYETAAAQVQSSARGRDDNPFTSRGKPPPPQ